MEEKVGLENKIVSVSCKADQLGTIAWVAASAAFAPEQCEKILDDVLYGIKALSEQISADLMKIIDEECAV